MKWLLQLRVPFGGSQVSGGSGLPGGSFFGNSFFGNSFFGDSFFP